MNRLTKIRPILSMIALAVTINFFVSEGWCKDSKSSWEKLMEDGIKLWDEGEIRKSGVKFSKAIEEAERLRAPLPEIAELYHCNARVEKRVALEDQHPPTDAIRSFKTVIKLYSQNHQAPDKWLAYSHFELANLFADEIKSDKQAWIEYEQSVAVSKQAHLKPTEIADMYSSWAAREQSRGILSLAETHFKEAVALRETSREPDSWLLNELLKNYVLTGNYVDSAPVFEKALTVFRKSSKLPGTQEFDRVFLADAANDIGIGILTAGQPTKALALLKQAVAMRQEIQRKKFDDVRRSDPALDTSISLCALGRCYAKLGQPAMAIQALKQAYALARPHKEESYLWSQANLVDACATIAKDQCPCSQREIQRVYSLYDKQYFTNQKQWVLYQEISNRLCNYPVSHIWSTEDVPLLLKIAERTIGNDAVGNRMQALANAQFNRRDPETAWKYVMQAANSMKGKNAETVEALFSRLTELTGDSELGESQRISRLGDEIDWLAKERPKSAATRKIAQDYLMALKSNTFCSEEVISETLMKHLELLDTILGSDNPLLISMLPKLAAEHEHHQRYYDAMITYKRIVDNYKKTYGKSSRKTKDALLKYSQLLEATNDIQGSAQVRKEAQ